MIHCDSSYPSSIQQVYPLHLPEHIRDLMLVFCVAHILTFSSLVITCEGWLHFLWNITSDTSHFRAVFPPTSNGNLQLLHPFPFLNTNPPTSLCVSHQPSTKEKWDSYWSSWILNYFQLVKTILSVKTLEKHGLYSRTLSAPQLIWIQWFEGNLRLQ